MTLMTSEERFQYCAAIILEHEGGLSKDKLDPGGTTNFGISSRFIRDNQISTDPDYVLSLTKDDAIEIYREYWWYQFHYERFTQIDVIAKVFDLAVNMGQITAHKILQRSCNAIKTGPQLQVDGLLGPATISASNTLGPLILRQALRDSAKERYLEIIAAKPAMKEFEQGWLVRAAW